MVKIVFAVQQDTIYSIHFEKKVENRKINYFNFWPTPATPISRLGGGISKIASMNPNSLPLQPSMQNFSKIGPATSAGDGLGSKNDHHIL